MESPDNSQKQASVCVQLEQLANPQTWINAATQIFFSLGLGFGSLIAFSSYNHHNNDFEKQAVVISLINSGTSVFASVVTFSIYGFKATFNYESCLERYRRQLQSICDRIRSYGTQNVDDYSIKH